MIASDAAAQNSDAASEAESFGSICRKAMDAKPCNATEQTRTNEARRNLLPAAVLADASVCIRVSAQNRTGKIASGHQQSAAAA